MKKLMFLGILAAGGVLLVSLGSWQGRAGCNCLPSLEKATGEYNLDDRVAVFQNRPVEYPLALREGEEGKEGVEGEGGVVLGERLADRWIEVDLSEQKLYAHEGNQVIYEFLISSGKWGRTPTGEFRIWSKFRYTTMSGGSKLLRTYYYLPNVPYTQYFYKDFGLHGTYWHSNFGEPMSHGCINLSIPDAEKLFWWTSPVMTDGETMIRATGENPGTRIIIHE